MRIVIFFVFVLLLIFGSTVLYAQNTPEYTSVQQKLATLGFEIPTQNVMAIDFTLKDMKGNDISLSSLQGKFVFGLIDSTLSLVQNPVQFFHTYHLVTLEKTDIMILK